MSEEPTAGRELSGLSDLELIELCLERGDADDRPFAELFRRHRRYVWRLCLRFFGNAQDAEDLTQDVFFTVYRKLGQFRGESSFRTWLSRIASNLCKNELRRRSRRPKTFDEPVEEVAEAMTNGGPDAEIAAANRRAVGRLAAAFETLKPGERQILTAVEVEQRSYREMAQAEGVSLSAVKMRVLRARTALRDAMRRLEEGIQG